MVGPDYVKPPVLTPEKFKELKVNPGKDWKLAAPRDSVDAGPWWALYRDSTLDQLEEEVVLSNQNVAAAIEAYEQARTLIREAQSALFPTVSTGYSTTRQYIGAALTNTGSSTTSATPSTGGSTTTTTPGSTGSRGRVTAIYTPQGTLTWTVDIWGQIRRQIESDVAGAQVSAANLVNAKLTAQAALATAYFNRKAAGLAQGDPRANRHGISAHAGNHAQSIQGRHGVGRRCGDRGDAVACDGSASDQHGRRHRAI